MGTSAPDVNKIIRLYNSDQIGSIADYCHEQKIDYRSLLKELRARREEINLKVIDAQVAKRNRLKISGYLLDYYEINSVSGALLAEAFGYSSASGNIFRALRQHPLYLGRMTVTKEYPENFINNHNKQGRKIVFRGYLVSDQDFSLYCKIKGVLGDSRGQFSRVLSTAINNLEKIPPIDPLIPRQNRITVGLTRSARERIEAFKRDGIPGYAVIIEALLNVETRGAGND